MQSKLVSAVIGFSIPGLLVLACGSTSNSPSHPTDASADRGRVSRVDGQVVIPGPCRITVESPDILPATHVPIGTEVQYNSSPPSSGPHYPIWAAYRTYTTAVDRRYYVHDLEHGAVVLLYKCANPTECDERSRGMEGVANSLPDDPSCAGTNGVRLRVLITPDDLLDVPVAAAAWGWVYKAECVDPPSLKQFALDHYGQGPEDLCANGQAPF